MVIREQYEEREARELSTFAVLSRCSRGRERAEIPCEIRTDFQRDRDRLIHSRAFRRLKHKTQVFIAPLGDHYRTRLTHTLEVAQIARTIARALRLNEDLAEAIALGHDLGHTPFGHAGEEVLNELLPGGFQHDQQSVRVVEHLESDGAGLNLTWEVRDGIRNHTRNGNPATVEGQVIQWADRIAYINHDIADAVRANIITPADLPESCTRILGSYAKGTLVNRMVSDIIQNSSEQPSICMSMDVAQAMQELRAYMFDRVYIGSRAKREEQKAKSLLKLLFQFYLDHPEHLGHVLRECSLERDVADYIAGMTDRYAVMMYHRFFIPEAWSTPSHDEIQHPNV